MGAGLRDRPELRNAGVWQRRGLLVPPNSLTLPVISYICSGAPDLCLYVELAFSHDSGLLKLVGEEGSAGRAGFLSLLHVEHLKDQGVLVLAWRLSGVEGAGLFLLRQINLKSVTVPTTAF